RAEDSEIRALLDKATTALHTGDSGIVSAVLTEAWRECTARKLRRDCALVQAARSAAQLAAGEFDEAKARMEERLGKGIDMWKLAFESRGFDSHRISN